MKKVMAGVAAVATLALAGCASATPRGPSESDGSVKQAADNAGFAESKVTLSDGRTITCITWSTWDFFNEAMSSGIDCDWPPPPE